MAELFQRIEERREDYIVDVSVSFLEIYNEEIRDLLLSPGCSQQKGGLAIREDSSNRVTVSGLTELVPTSAEEVNAIVQAGNARRTQSPTHANATSSRSHAVLQINVTQSPRTADVKEERTMATLSIIDLAGSERASATKNMGKRMVEGANINKSLLALGNCINALCEPKTRAHIPYRNSKLTRLLKFSLGGNCRTVMIVCVAPTSKHLEDTGNTLAYANRAKEIKTKVSKNIMDVDRHVGQYVEAISRLNDEVRELKAKLAGEMALENDAAKRRRLNAAKAVEAARVEMRSLAEKNRATIGAGSTCVGRVAASQATLEVINQRITELNAKGELSSDLATEQEFLRSLIAGEEALIRKESDTISRGANAHSLFTTTVNLARKRTSDEWDESAPLLLQMEGAVALAEMRATKAECERDGLRSAVGAQAKLISSLIGMLARTNTLVGDSIKMLSAETPDAVSIATQLQTLLEVNDRSFVEIIGASTKSISVRGNSGLQGLSTRVAVQKRSSLTHPTTMRPRVSAGGRRSSLNTVSSPGRRGFRSPRKPSSLRQSVSSNVEKKSVRWNVPVNPDESFAEASGRTTPTPKVPSPYKPCLPQPESDWEDDRTDDSSIIGNQSSSLSLDAAIESISDSLKSSLSQGPTKPSSTGRLRAKFQPDFLKPKPTLGRVTEEAEATPRRTILGDHNYSSTSRPLASSTKTRRKSNVGPQRSDRIRRRSSQIPQLSPTDKSSKRYNEGAASDTSFTKRSPKKVKRSSLLGALKPSSIRPSLLKLSGDTSGSNKPGWK